ncbi:HTH_Tnp_Tc3_2 domain-containing protein [Trichonephila clavipes]|uniref:HTH_Tnp_Tc3_2 domain-containing protein n=1 Tax=Trichonephila clavipes TaxID=2585209 RepID=A0A8X7BJW3_TRICX|nr:HTH_Tnp_Tc3_2 domain-containing protein [Trichonephila clavipes]
MKTAGWLTRRVAGEVDRSECAVRNCWEQWTREGTHARKTVSGATRKTTRREDGRIVRQALVDPTVTRSTTRADVRVATVPQTISRHLAETNLKSKRPFWSFPLTPKHRQLRCNVASPNINSCRRLCWTRHPHVHLAAAAQPLFDPRGIEHRRPEDERERDALNLHGSGSQRFLLSQNIGL